MIELAIMLVTCFIPGFVGAYIVDKMEDKENEKIAYKSIWKQKMKNDEFNVYMK